MLAFAVCLFGRDAPCSKMPVPCAFSPLLCCIFLTSASFFGGFPFFLRFYFCLLQSFTYFCAALVYLSRRDTPENFPADGLRRGCGQGLVRNKKRKDYETPKEVAWFGCFVFDVWTRYAVGPKG